MHQKLIMLVSILGLLVLAFGSTGSALGEAIKANRSVEVPDIPLPAAQDYATASSGNAWDMNEFSDVSQYLNGEVVIAAWLIFGFRTEFSQPALWEIIVEI